MYGRCIESCALAWRLYVKKKICYLCWKGRSGWTKQWLGNRWCLSMALEALLPVCHTGTRAQG